MAVTGTLYGLGVSAILNGQVDWDSDTINVSLHTSTYTPDQDAHDFFDDATNELATANGYTAGGVALTGKTRSYTGADNTAHLDANDPTFPLSGSVTFRYMVFRKARGGAASADELVGWVDFGTDQTVAVPFTVQLHADGAFKAVVA